MRFLTPTTTDNKRLLGVYTYYRLFLALMLGVMHWTKMSKDVFGHVHPQLFSDIALIYTMVCALTVIMFWADRLKTTPLHLLSMLVVDFVALITMIYASGSLSSGLGYLLLIPMAVSGTFLRGQTNIGLAAFATLLVLAMSVFSIHIGQADDKSFFSAGVTGVSLFVTAIAFRIFAERIQASEFNAEQQTAQANYLQLISQRIVETMRTGIFVIDKNYEIPLMNDAAERLLFTNAKYKTLQHLPEVTERINQWVNTGTVPNTVMIAAEGNQSIKLSFALLDDDRYPSLMVFVEDMQRLNQEAQQLKLASLGRLTASIAHEIRNPLGAISHASQLLNESEHIHENDSQLLEIIHNHSQRINFIINNILEFSRRKNASPTVINLNEWLTDFKTEYLQHHEGELFLNFRHKKILAKMDPNHLYQIINNLVDNGLRYSEKSTKHALVEIVADIQTSDSRPSLKIINLGEGINETDQQQMFEPFFTTESTGSGLGLYLCRELSEANQANLSYSYDPEQYASIFKLVLSHPQRQIELV